MGKTISFIGNPGTGKTTFLLSSVHRLTEIDWAEIDLKKLPKNYGQWIDLLVTGGTLPPTVKQFEYELKFKKEIQYKTSKVKLGRWFGRIKMKARDLRGEDYRRTTEKFKEAVHKASAVIVTIDPSGSTDLAASLGGQIQPLIDGIRYLIEEERKHLKYLALVVTKRSFHNHAISDIRKYVRIPLGPILRYLKKEKIAFRVLEVDSRGVDNRLEPWGLEAVYYDVFAHICKVQNHRIDIEKDPDHVWVDTRPHATPAQVAAAQKPQPKPNPTPQAPSSKPPTPLATAPSGSGSGGSVVYMVICPSCGHKSPQGLTKCKNCGAPI